MRNITSKSIVICALFSLLTFSTKLLSIVGAGVLPYAINPKDHKVYFLFSREAFGPAKGTCSDFGGKANKFEKNNPKHAAARECAEESINLFGNRHRIHSFLSKRHRNTFSIGRDYVMYFVPITYDHNINIKFLKARSKTFSIHSKEKNKLIWIRADKLLNALRHNKLSMFVHNQFITLRHCTFSLLKKCGKSIIYKLNKKRFHRKPVLR